MADELDLIPLDPQWRCFYEDGSTLDLVSDPRRMEATLNAFAPRSGAAEGYQRPRWGVTVKMDDGGTRTVQQRYEPFVREGDRVRIIGTQLELVD